MPTSVKTVISESLKDLEKLGEQILGPLFARTAKQFENILFSLHKENFGGNDIARTETQPSSQYIRNLQIQITVFQSCALSKFTAGPWLSKNILLLSSRIVEYFIRQATLLRPLGEQGKLKLAADMAQLEFVIGPLQSVRELGCYRALRALRPFIFVETLRISECDEVSILAPSAVLHHLFSRASASLQSPHTLQNWTLIQYDEWLEKHTEQDIWILIKKCLDTYASQVNARGEKEFTPLYPLMLSLGPTLLSKWNQSKEVSNK